MRRLSRGSGSHFLEAAALSRSNQLALPLPEPDLPAPIAEPIQEPGSPQAVMAFLLRLRARGISDVGVLRALELVPRDLFVPIRYRDLAWRDMALPIACGQTMPEAWLVARMLEALDLDRSHRVLEIGTGSGYATAMLAQLAGEVVSYDIFEALSVESRARLTNLGLKNVEIRHGDAFELLATIGQFDRILVHGIVQWMPDALLGALKDGGVMVLGRRGGTKHAMLTKLVKQGAEHSETELCACRLGGLIGLSNN